MDPAHIRNFSIIAHIDHGKTTLSDRVLELTHAVSQREMTAQVLDDMDLERERGITIKARAVTLDYQAPNGATYQLNLIDTPGHVDFSYEVSRALAACDGAVLVVDASQGVEAQTVANALLAQQHDLAMIAVMNKIDLPGAEIDRTAAQIAHILPVMEEEILLVSAKTGEGVPEILEAIVDQVPPPRGEATGALRGLIFDSWYNPYRGVIFLVRVVDGRATEKMKLRLMSNAQEYQVEELGVFRPKQERTGELAAGEVGYVIAGIKNLTDIKIGDTVTDAAAPATEPLPGFREPKPMVFAGLYPTSAEDFEDLKKALEKLQLNDASIQAEPETSKALGFGFRVGYLGLLHMEIIQERLEREFNLDLITTAPNVRYQVHLTDGLMQEIENPRDLPSGQFVDHIDEPVLEAKILCQEEYLGNVLKLLEERRGEQTKFEYLSAATVMLTYDLPMNEMVVEFYDRLKSVSKGYASLDYHLKEYRRSDLVRLDILVNGEEVDALSIIVHRSKAYYRGRALVEKMKELIPRQLFEVIIQAAIGSKVIARSRVAPLRKNVIAKCYGGDVTRKRKLLERQKEGKKRMKRIGKVDLPQEAFLALLRID